MKCKITLDTMSDIGVIKKKRTVKKYRLRNPITAYCPTCERDHTIDREYEYTGRQKKPWYICSGCKNRVASDILGGNLDLNR